jgi:signal transduction histidine kinase/CheY-like chemotaxis protein
VRHLQRSWDTGEPWEDIFPLRGKDGEYRWFLSRALPIRDETGNVICWFGTNTDITEQREMENRITQQAEQLANESRLKDEFLAMLSHELRNPLAPIRSAVYLLRLYESGSESPLHREARDIIERQVLNLTKLIDDLLEVSRVATGRIRLNLQSVDLNRVVRHAAETIKPQIEQHRHRLELNLDPEPIWVSADETRIEEVFINLLTNAAKYTDEGGRIEVYCERPPNAGGDTARVRVRDNGIGIDKELLTHVFDLFRQADRSLVRSAGGLGIGLSLVRRLIDLHGGTVEARSPPEGMDIGSEFIVNLPLTQAPQAPDPVQPVASDSKNASQPPRLKVLIVDDNVDQATMLTSVLQHSGHEVRSAHTGPDGFNAALQWCPDVVLLDIGLPGLDGYEVARRLRSDPNTKAGRLIALTGYARENDISLAREAGFDAHLAKPLDFGELNKLLPLRLE